MTRKKIVIYLEGVDDLPEDNWCAHIPRGEFSPIVVSANSIGECIIEIGKSIQVLELHIKQTMTPTATYIAEENCLQELPQPILVTHDGVEIFEGDEFWGVRDWRVLEGGKADKYDKNLYKAAPVFSTRSAAEEYILNHKPVLSLNDVREWVEAAIRSNLSMDFILEKAEHTVKQKLNPDNLKK